MFTRKTGHPGFERPRDRSWVTVNIDDRFGARLVERYRLGRAAGGPDVVDKSALSNREEKGFERITAVSAVLARLQSLRGSREDLLGQFFGLQRIVRPPSEEREDPLILLRRRLGEIMHLLKESVDRRTCNSVPHRRAGL